MPEYDFTLKFNLPERAISQDYLDTLATVGCDDALVCIVLAIDVIFT